MFFSCCSTVQIPDREGVIFEALLNFLNTKSGVCDLCSVNHLDTIGY